MKSHSLQGDFMFFAEIPFEAGVLPVAPIENSADVWPGDAPPPPPK